jgi:NAD-dependent SIR2 family protein deacetylase
MSNFACGHCGKTISDDDRAYDAGLDAPICEDCRRGPLKNVVDKRKAAMDDLVELSEELGLYNGEQKNEDS